MFFSPLIFSKASLVLGLEVFAASFLAYILGYAIYNRFFHPYKDIPGPFWASITSLWYFRAIRYARGDDTQLPIHKKYGPMVRVTPNHVQIADPAAIETIYGPKTVFQKDEFYKAFDPKISKRQDNFTETDEKVHGRRRRLVAPFYSQGAVLEYEPCVDRLITLFYKRMEQFCNSGETIDMAKWLRCYTFDVVGEIFFGREGGFGFLRDDIDYNNWCHHMDHMPNPGAAQSYVPKGFRTLWFMSELLRKEARDGVVGLQTVTQEAKTAVTTRVAEMEAGKPYNPNDVLSKIIGLAQDPKVDFALDDCFAEIWTVIWAGADTTAIALTSIFYHLHKYPDTMEKLLDEIESAFANGTLKYPVRFNDAIKLPYLHAVVRESMRIHPSLGTGLPRVVPEGGMEICGRFFPGGLGVIMNQNAVHFDKGVFGDDSEEFVPERWLRDGKDRADFMERHILQFGYGPRICIGKHITNIEMYKLLPTILRDFHFDRMSDEWKVQRGWFHQQKNVLVKVSRRRPKTPGQKSE